LSLAQTIGGWIGGLLFVAAAFGGSWLHGYTHGKSKTERVWAEKLVVAERAARQTEVDLAAIAAASAKRMAAKEAALHEQADRQNAEWRSLLAGLPRRAARCRRRRARNSQRGPPT